MKNIDICIGSSSYDNIKELLISVDLSNEDVNEMNIWHIKSPHRFYDKVNKVPFFIKWPE